MENPADEMAWMRLLALLDGVGTTTAAHIFEAVQNSSYNFTVLTTLTVPSAAQADVRKLAQTLLDVNCLETHNLTAQLDRCRQFYIPVLEKNYENSQPRSSDITHLVSLASTYSSSNFSISPFEYDIFFLMIPSVTVSNVMYSFFFTKY
jgi:hypothetical protein